jgi:hypothetical protein
VNVIVPQTMRCIFCHNNPILNINPKTQAGKKLIIYNTTNDITALRKHVNLNHFTIFNFFEKKKICPLREMKDNLPKRDQMFFLIPYLVFFVAKEPFKKDDL